MASKTIGKLEGTITIAEPPMISPAAQAVAASGSTKGAPLFVAADPDLVAKEGVAQDSWFVISHLTSGNSRLDLLVQDRKSTRLNSSHQIISYAVFCLKKKTTLSKLLLHIREQSEVMSHTVTSSRTSTDR